MPSLCRCQARYMLYCLVCTLTATSAPRGMPILGEVPLLERLDRGVGLAVRTGPPPGFRTQPLRLWQPTMWSAAPAHTCPLPPVSSMALCREACQLPGQSGADMTHLFDYMASSPLWYPWYYKGKQDARVVCQTPLSAAQTETVHK